MKFAVICSAGGASFFAAYDVLIKTNRYCKEDFVVITDRDCGAEQESKLRGIECHRILFETKDQFSTSTAQLLLKKNVEVVLMLYSRMISSALFLALPTLNLHPALLPSFKGMNAVGQAIDAGVKFIGATMHVTTEKMDDGAILAQVLSPIQLGFDQNKVNKISYLQKTYLILAVLDCIETNFLRINFHNGIAELRWADMVRFSNSANPCIQSLDLADLFQNHQKSVGIGSAIQ